ncbi:MAG TPA: hypothetical protein VGC95_04405, partial [Chitinophagaceae bacterium]
MKQFTQNRFLVVLVALLLAANLAVMLYFFVFRKHEHRTVSDHPVSDFIQKELGLTTAQQQR